MKVRLLQLIERLDERQLRLVLAFVLGLLK